MSEHTVAINHCGRADLNQKADILRKWRLKLVKGNTAGSESRRELTKSVPQLKEPQ
jgi:hypothetical protein